MIVGASMAGNSISKTMTRMRFMKPAVSLFHREWVNEGGPEKTHHDCADKKKGQYCTNDS